MTVMSKQSEEQWEEAKALAPPAKQEAQVDFTCLEQKVKSLEQLDLNAGYHLPGRLG